MRNVDPSAYRYVSTSTHKHGDTGSLPAEDERKPAGLAAADHNHL